MLLSVRKGRLTKKERGKREMLLYRPHKWLYNVEKTILGYLIILHQFVSNNWSHFPAFLQRNIIPTVCPLRAEPSNKVERWGSFPSSSDDDNFLIRVLFSRRKKQLSGNCCLGTKTKSSCFSFLRPPIPKGRDGVSMLSWLCIVVTVSRYRGLYKIRCSCNIGGIPFTL